MKKFFVLLRNICKLIKISIKQPEKYNVIDEAINSYSFDYAYLYNIEKKKMIEMREYFKENGISENNEKIIKLIDLAIKLIEIANEETDTFGYRFLDKVYSNEKVTPGDINLDDEYYCKVNVNLKNWKRFFDDNEFMARYLPKCPHELYIKKAQYLYHKIRYYFEQYWWD
jgi:hypothetical protein